MEMANNQTTVKKPAILEAFQWLFHVSTYSIDYSTYYIEQSQNSGSWLELRPSRITLTFK